MHTAEFCFNRLPQPYQIIMGFPLPCSMALWPLEGAQSCEQENL